MLTLSWQATPKVSNSAEKGSRNACVDRHVSHLWVFLHSFSDPRLCSVQELSAPVACCLWFPGSLMCPHEMLSVQQSWTTVAGTQLSVFWFLCRTFPDVHQSLSDSGFWSKRLAVFPSFSLCPSPYLLSPTLYLPPRPHSCSFFFFFFVSLVLAQLPGLHVTLFSRLFSTSGPLWWPAYNPLPILWYWGSDRAVCAHTESAFSFGDKSWRWYSQTGFEFLLLLSQTLTTGMAGLCYHAWLKYHLNIGNHFLECKSPTC